MKKPTFEIDPADDASQLQKLIVICAPGDQPHEPEETDHISLAKSTNDDQCYSTSK
jgi:hypothetical protein